MAEVRTRFQPVADVVTAAVVAVPPTTVVQFASSQNQIWTLACPVVTAPSPILIVAPKT